MPNNYITLPQLTKTTKGLVNKINTESTVINSKIGNLANLNTTTKTDLVAAINEAASSSGTTYDDTALAGRVTALENAGYITSYTETDPTVPTWAKEATKPTYTAAEVGALPDTTTIPTKTSQLTNDSGFVTNADIPTTTSQLINDSGFVTNSDVPALATVATSGDYDDLINKPAIPAAQVQSDWNATSGMGVILNKPTIPAATTVTNTLASGTLIATINGTNIYAPAYTDVDWVSY